MKVTLEVSAHEVFRALQDLHHARGDAALGFAEKLRTAALEVADPKEAAYIEALPSDYRA